MNDVNNKSLEIQRGPNLHSLATFRPFGRFGRQGLAAKHSHPPHPGTVSKNLTCLVKVPHGTRMAQTTLYVF